MLAAAGLFVLVALPPVQLTLAPLDNAALPAVVAGVVHVHSSRSDGSGSPDEIAAAAARAGLDFVALTDHGDGTRVPDPPRYRSGVLVLDGVEISTTGGHYVALGLPRAPYPLGGEARDVVEDVARLGGFGIAAHPDSPRDALRWREGTAPFDAIEWINGDSEWRDETSVRLAMAAVVYPFRPVETLASLLDRPSTTMLRWDALTQRRMVVGLAGADAHARFGLASDGESYADRAMLRLPSYETVFSTFSIRVEPAEPLSGNPAADAARLLGALRAGRVYSVVDGLAAPAQFELVARSGGAAARQGQALDAAGPVSVEARSNAPSGSVTTLFRNGEAVAEVPGPELSETLAPGPAVLRVEVRLAGDRSHVPWIVSNPVYVSRLPPRALPPPPPATAALPLEGPGADDRFRIERDGSSRGALDAAREGSLGLRFTLGTGIPAPYVALVVPGLAPLREAQRVAFRARADAPMRLSVQLRRNGEAGGQRWRRSVYLDTSPREIIVVFRDMTPIGPTETFTPDMPAVDDLLLAVDTTNTAPGTSGRVVIEGLRLEQSGG